MDIKTASLIAKATNINTNNVVRTNGTKLRPLSKLRSNNK